MFANATKIVRSGAAAGLLLLGATAAVAQGAPQASHKAFVLVEYQVRDKPLFAKLREQVRETLKTYKGDVVTREKVEPIFGGSATNISVVSFATVQDARTWLGSKELAALSQERDKAAQVTTYLVEKLD